jgi:hypothetical protein
VLSGQCLPTQIPSVSHWKKYNATSDINSFTLRGTKTRSRHNLPDCADSFPTSNSVAAVNLPDTVEIDGGIYENRRFTLDSVQDQNKINEILRHKNSLIMFKHCLVVYRGWDVNLIIGWDKHPVQITLEGRAEPIVGGVSGNSLAFEDCIFDFNVEGPPHPRE